MAIVLLSDWSKLSQVSVRALHRESRAYLKCILLSNALCNHLWVYIYWFDNFCQFFLNAFVIGIYAIQAQADNNVVHLFILPCNIQGPTLVG